MFHTRFDTVNIIESIYLIKQVETVRSIKRRAKKPWAKGKFSTVPDTDIYQTPEGFICHPAVAKQLREELCKVSPTP